MTTQPLPTDLRLDFLSGHTVNYRTEGDDNLMAALFVRLVANRHLGHVARDKVPVAGQSVSVLGEFASLVEYGDGPEEDGEKAWILHHDDDQSTLVWLKDGWAEVWTAGRDAALARETCRGVAQQVRAPASDGSITPVTFWALHPYSRWPIPRRRTVKTPSWAGMTDNYSDETVTQMERVMALDGCPDARLILWHGPSGTGKTHALRALARHWAPWCNVAFITDPEEFVGGSPIYMLNVSDFAAGYSVAEAEKRSTVVVLEDAGELMAADARTSTGQGLSRLLNLTDGLLGQSLKVMVLITTNEPIGAMHPAVVRAGRCFAEIEFGPLPTAKANRWLAERGCETRVEAPTALADLFAIVGHETPQ